MDFKQGVNPHTLTHMHWAALPLLCVPVIGLGEPVGGI